MGLEGASFARGFPKLKHSRLLNPVDVLCSAEVTVTSNSPAPFVSLRSLLTQTNVLFLNVCQGVEQASFCFDRDPVSSFRSALL